MTATTATSPAGAGLLLEREAALATVQAWVAAPLTQTRHGLVLAEAGMGKTALLQAFQQELLAKHPHVAVLPLCGATLAANGDLAMVVVHAWRTWAAQRLAQALVQVNAINEPLGIVWSQGDLLRALSLIKLQTDVDALMPQGEFLPRQQLANAIRSAIPKVKRLHFSAVNQGIRQLVDHLQEPWLAVAAQITHPTVTITRQLFDPADITDGSGDRATGSDDDTAIDTSLTPQVNATDWTTIQAFHTWLNTQLPGEERAVMVLDDWDALVQRHPALIENGLTLLAPIGNISFGQRAPQLVQVVLACRAEAASRAMSPELWAACQPPLVLSALTPRAERHLFEQQVPGLAASVPQRFRAACEGNPLLIVTVAGILRRQLAENGDLTPDQLALLGLQRPTDVWELLWNRLLVAHMPHEGNVLRVVAALLQFTGAPSSPVIPAFVPESLIDNIHASQQLGRVFVSSVLHTLVQQGLVEESQSSSGRPTGEWRFTSRVAVALMAEKTRWVQADVPCEEKLVYLKKVIPLSIQAGEFDAQRTQEAIALASSAGFAELRPFLEETLIEASQVSHPLPQRLNAVNCLATLASPLCIQRLRELADDAQPTLQEYALRNLKTLAQEQRLTMTEAEPLCQQLLPLLDARTEAQRLLAYQTIAALPLPQGSTPLTAVYLKGLVDQSVAVRQLCIAQLQHADMNTALVRHALIDATRDSDPDVRRQACLNLQRQPHPKVVEALLAVLEHDDNPQLRALAVRMIATQPGEQTAATLMTALQWDMDPNVQVSVVRALRLFPGLVTEQALCDRLNSSVSRAKLPVEVQWAIVQTLGELATQASTLMRLDHLAHHATDTFLKTSARSAVHAVQHRLAQGGVASLHKVAETVPPANQGLLVSAP